MNRSTLLRCAAIALLLLALPLPTKAAAPAPLSGECPRRLENLWQAAAHFLANVDLPGLRQAIDLLIAPEPPQEEREGKLPPPSPNLGADMDPNG